MGARVFCYIPVTSLKLDFRNFRPLETPLARTANAATSASDLRPTARHARDAARPRTPTSARSRQRTAAPPTSTTSISMRKLSGALLGILGGRHASALNITLQEYSSCSRHATVCGADADVAAGADAFAWQPQCTPKLLISHVCIGDAVICVADSVICLAARLLPRCRRQPVRRLWHDPRAR
jgi:hypothetical protein